jgi:uncharacterized protein (DUF2336 family)
MPAAQAVFLPELEQALRHVPIDRHAEMVRRVTGFFLAGASGFNAEHVDLFDRVLGRLMVAVDVTVLTELSRRLAPVRNAPPGVMRRLAGNPNIAVAAPVLSRATHLEDHELVSIVVTQSQAHLLTISGRCRLNEAVTDALVECGDRDVARNLALNHAARFSEAGLTALVERAGTDPILAEKLAQRHDVAPGMLRSLVHASAGEVRDRLMAVARDDQRSEIATVVSEISRETADAADEAEAIRTVRVLQRRGELDQVKVLEFARGGRTRHTFAALALICDVSVEVVRRLMQGDQPEAALILCQAAGFGWPTARAIVEATRAADSPAHIAVAFAALDRLTPATAAEIVGFWKAAA